MAGRRKTVDERRSEKYEADHRAWEDFRPKLVAVRSFTDAVALVRDAIPHDAPGRQYYSNLGFFLQPPHTPPAGANVAELNEYLRLIRLFDAEGAVEPGHRPKIEARLLAAIGQQIPQTSFEAKE